MSLRPQPSIPPVPDDTARIARAALRRGNSCLLLRDQLGAVFDDAGFADFHPKRGQPAYAPWRLALVTLLQFREGLSDLQAAEAVRAWIDWKYLLALNLADPGFDHSVLCEFRGRLLGGDATERLLARVLDATREAGLLKARGRQRTDSTHVLAAMRELNRIELLAETLRAALNAITVAAPDWLHAVAHPEWHERYGRRIEDRRLPETGPKRDAYAVQVGTDGHQRLDAVAVLRRVWARRFERDEDGRGGGVPPNVRLQSVEGRGPGDRIESPYDADARYRSKSNMNWTGYMVHLTEACDAGAPHLVLHADTTPANVHEAMRVEAIHAALAAKGLVPSEHLVDSAYISADHLIRAREQNGIDLIGPGRSRTGWQARTKGAFDTADFAIDWKGEVARCPESRTSTSWRCYYDKATGPYIRVRFSAANCNPCPSKARCTRGRDQGRQLTLPAREQHEALAAARARRGTDQGRALYAQRQGIEGTISQGMRGFGLRRAHYRGLAKTGLQGLATAAAINFDRLAAWLAKRPLAPTRVSRFAAMTA